MPLKPLFKIKIETPKQSTELLLNQDAVTVGRSPDNEVPIESVGISRRHLKIEIVDGEIQLTDLNSTNGTFYQGVRLKPNLPAAYQGGVIHLGPATDGNKLEVLQETAFKDETRTFTQKKAALAAREVSRRIEPDPVPTPERAREPEPSALRERSAIRSPERERSVVSEPKSAVREISRMVEAPVTAPDPQSDVPARKEVSIAIKPRKLHESPVHDGGMDLESIREELKRLREEYAEALKLREESDLQLRNIRAEVEECESRLTAMRERTKEEEARLKRRLSEMDEKLKTEQEILQTRRDEISHERDELNKMEKDLFKRQAEIEREKEQIAADLSKIRSKHKEERESLELDHKLERRKMEDEHEGAMARLTAEQANLKKKIADETVLEKERVRHEIEAEKKRVESEFAIERKRLRTEFLNDKERLESEMAAEKDRLEDELTAAKKRFVEEKRKLQEDQITERRRLNDELAAEKARTKDEREKLIADAAAERERVEAETKAHRERFEAEAKAELEKQERELKEALARIRDEREKFESDAAAEKRRQEEDLADHIERITKERSEVDSLHKAFLDKIKEDETLHQTEFDAKEKKLRLQLDSLTAEIELRQAQELRQIEQRKTEKLVAERELGDVRQQVEGAKKELATLSQSMASLREAIAQREKEQSRLSDSISKLDTREKGLQEEIQRQLSVIEQKRVEIGGLETQFAEQKKRNQLEHEKMVRAAEEESAAIVAKGVATSEMHWKQELEKLQREIVTGRGQAKAQLESDVADWERELQQRKTREQNEMNLWFAEEKKKIQERLSGDLDVFVDSVTSAAMVQMKQNPQFNNVMHEFHAKFSDELRRSLTMPHEEFVAAFNPDRKKSTQTFWVKSAVAAVLVVAAGFLAKVAPDYIRAAAHERRISSDDGATGEWVRKIQREREQRLALKLETRADFQDDYVSNVLYNEGYLEMKLDPHFQGEWVKELNTLLVGEKAMGMDEEALVDYIRVEHSLFVDLAEKKAKMNALNKDEFIRQMDAAAKKTHDELVLVLKNKTLPSSDKARQTSAEQKWKAIREAEESFYSAHVTNGDRRPAGK